ncbi:MAG TPA: ATP-binding cassette domain-containing protein [Sedimentisphaerales bacterium]|nr:ATP-binding cassette domain-containing protein [Sedimentisphaerales bacterium]
MNAVLLEQVCKSFGRVHAVDNLSVQVPTGSIYGFLGPNGAGKTTTLRMIMNIIRPDSGRIEIFKDGLIEKVKTRIGYMPEERGLYRKMTVSKILAYLAVLKGVPSEKVSASVSRCLQQIQLSSWADKKVEDLSRGMHQKLQFAVAVINEPELLIFDEPFSGLDPLNQELLKNIILEMRSEGRTIIFSTHVMHEAEKLCDCILLINKGKTILDGNLARIRSRYRSRAVCVEAQGSTDFIERLPIVTKVQTQQNQLEITLTEDADPQDLLEALVQKVRVQKFEVKVPSLHEIFVNSVGADNVQDS